MTYRRIDCTRPDAAIGGKQASLLACFSDLSRLPKGEGHERRFINDALIFLQARQLGASVLTETSGISTISPRSFQLDASFCTDLLQRHDEAKGITTVWATPSYIVELQFNDCEDGDVLTHTIRLSSTKSLQATGRTLMNLPARVFS